MFIRHKIKHRFARKFDQLSCRRSRNSTFVPFSLQQLIGLQENSGPVSHDFRLPGLRFNPVYEIARNQRHGKHNQKRQWIAGVIGKKRKVWVRKEKIKAQQTANGIQNTVETVSGHTGRQQHADNIKHHDIGFIYLKFTQKKSCNS